MPELTLPGAVVEAALGLAESEGEICYENVHVQDTDMMGWIDKNQQTSQSEMRMCRQMLRGMPT